MAETHDEPCLWHKFNSYNHDNFELSLITRSEDDWVLTKILTKISILVLEMT